MGIEFREGSLLITSRNTHVAKRGKGIQRTVIELILTNEIVRYIFFFPQEKNYFVCKLHSESCMVTCQELS